MYRLARQSIVRLIADATTAWPEPIGFYEFDGHAEGEELPNQDLFGIMGYSCVQDGQFHDVTFAVVIMTMDDPGLDRSTRYIDWFYARLAAHQKIPIYAENGELAGFDITIFDGTSAAPMERVDARPTAQIQISGRVSRAGEAPQ